MVDGQGGFSSGRPERRACGLCKGLAGALLECAFCNTGLACVEKREIVFYDCGQLVVEGYWFSTCWEEVRLFKVKIMRISPVSARVRPAMGGL